MKKRVICIVLTICLLLLPGCQQNRENRANMELFRNGFKQLQELSSLHVRNEQYNETKLLTVRNEWRNGEDFYWSSDRGTRYLSYGGNYWTYDFPPHTDWEKRERRIESISTWWNNYEPDDFFVGYVTFRKDGEYIILEQTEDLGSDNCTFSRQISTNTFYIDEDGKIVRITLMMVTYSGREVEPGKIHSISKREYYITPMDAKEVEKQIQRQYQTLE